MSVLETRGIPQMFAAFSPDGDQVATVGFDKKIRLYPVQINRNDGRVELGPPVEKEYLRDDLPLSCVAFDPSRTGWLATASYDRMGRLWFRNGNQLDEKIRLRGHGAQIYEIAYSPQEEVVATASMDGTVRFWNLSGEEIQDRRFPEVGIAYSAKFHPWEKVVASAWGDGFVRLINATSGKLIRPAYRIPGSSTPALSVAFSDDGWYLGAVFANGTACVWECGGRPPDTWLEREPRRPPFQVHEGLATGIAFSPRSASSANPEPWFATSSGDGLVRLWSLNGRKLAEFKQHESIVRSIVFQPNTATLRLLTASLDGTVKLLKIDHSIESLEGLLQQACKWPGLEDLPVKVPRTPGSTFRT